MFLWPASGFHLQSYTCNSFYYLLFCYSLVLSRLRASDSRNPAFGGSHLMALGWCNVFAFVFQTCYWFIILYCLLFLWFFLFLFTCSTSSALAKLRGATGASSKQPHDEKKETPQERLKRIMSKQLNKQSTCLCLLFMASSFRIH